jgi:hypothetical protein
MPVGNFSTIRKTWYGIAKDDAKIVHKQKGAEIQSFNFIDGYLIGAEMKEEEYEGNKIWRAYFSFAANQSNYNEVDVLQCGLHTMFTHDILNCLASLDDIGYIKITPFMSELEDKSKKFIRGAVRTGNGEEGKVKKKYSHAIIPKTEKVVVGKKEVIDSSARDEFFENLFVELQNKIKAKAPAQEQNDYDNYNTANDEVPF